MYSIKRLYKVGNGPSSSHTMGPKNAVRYILKYYPGASFYKMTLFGSLALTGKGHLADVVIEKTFGEIPHELCFNLKETSLEHPNTMLFEIAYPDGTEKKVTIFSIGGGLIRIKGEEEKKYVHCYPHHNFTEVREYCILNHLSLVQYIDQFDEEDIRIYMEHIYNTMMGMVDEGLSKEGELPGKLHVARKAKSIYDKRVPEENPTRREKRLVSAYAFAAAETNASGGTVATAPTCGACGILPALVRYYEEMGYPHESIIEALMVAGLIGLIIRDNASISGAECGCQAEIGTACSMGAAFVSQLKGLDIRMIERSAEIAMEHTLGLTCDPIEGYVQIPCIERNAVFALRAIEASALTDFIDTMNSKISLDVVVKTMYQTGIDLNKRYRETSIGGLAKNYKC